MQIVVTGFAVHHAHCMFVLPDDLELSVLLDCGPKIELGNVSRFPGCPAAHGSRRAWLKINFSCPLEGSQNRQLIVAQKLNALPGFEFNALQDAVRFFTKVLHV